MPAGRGQVGQLSIRVLPDTRKFKDDLRKALKRIERTVSATVQVGAELSRGSALKLKREIAALDAEMKVKATVDDADEAQPGVPFLRVEPPGLHDLIIGACLNGQASDGEEPCRRWVRG